MLEKARTTYIVAPLDRVYVGNRVHHLATFTSPETAEVEMHFTVTGVGSDDVVPFTTNERLLYQRELNQFATPRPAASEHAIPLVEMNPVLFAVVLTGWA